MPGIPIVAGILFGHQVALFLLWVERFYRFGCFSGTKGRNKGEFTNLQGVAASQGKVLIADSNNQCVQVNTALRL